MSVLNGDAPMRYQITQGNQTWIVKLTVPDEDGSKLQRWVADNQIKGELTVLCEWRQGRSWRAIGPITIDTATLRPS